MSGIPDHVSISKLTPAELWKGSLSDDIAKAELASRRLWENYNDYERAAILAAIRETMLRLFADPSWVPGTLKASAPDVLDVTFRVDLSELEKALEKMGYRRDEKLKEGLLNLVRRGSTED